MIPKKKVIQINKEIDKVLEFFEKHNGTIGELDMREEYIDPDILDFLYKEGEIKKMGRDLFSLTTYGRFRIQNGGYNGEYIRGYRRLYANLLLLVAWFALVIYQFTVLLITSI